MGQSADRISCLRELFRAVEGNGARVFRKVPGRVQFGRSHSHCSRFPCSVVAAGRKRSRELARGRTKCGITTPESRLQSSCLRKQAVPRIIQSLDAVDRWCNSPSSASKVRQSRLVMCLKERRLIDGWTVLVYYFSTVIRSSSGRLKNPNYQHLISPYCRQKKCWNLAAEL